MADTCTLENAIAEASCFECLSVGDLDAVTVMLMCELAETGYWIPS